MQYPMLRVMFLVLETDAVSSRCRACCTQKSLLSLQLRSRGLQAMALMEEKNIRHIPVFNGDDLLGMLSIKDIVSTFMDQHVAEMSSMSDYIAGGSY
jgi:signal-transduction protein with cAMP-binding, CBS, and nucleotidyltransferase domain